MSREGINCGRVQICVTVAQRHGESDVPTLKLVVESVGVKLCARDFDTAVSAYLGGVYVQHMLFKGLPSSCCIVLGLSVCKCDKPMRSMSTTGCIVLTVLETALLDTFFFSVNCWGDVWLIFSHL